MPLLLPLFRSIFALTSRAATTPRASLATLGTLRHAQHQLHTSTFTPRLTPRLPSSSSAAFSTSSRLPARPEHDSLFPGIPFRVEVNKGAKWEHESTIPAGVREVRKAKAAPSAPTAEEAATVSTAAPSTPLPSAAPKPALSPSRSSVPAQHTPFSTSPFSDSLLPPSSHLKASHLAHQTRQLGALATTQRGRLLLSETYHGHAAYSSRPDFHHPLLLWMPADAQGRSWYPVDLRARMGEWTSVGLGQRLGGLERWLEKGLRKRGVDVAAVLKGEWSAEVQVTKKGESSILSALKKGRSSGGGGGSGTPSGTGGRTIPFFTSGGDLPSSATGQRMANLKPRARRGAVYDPHMLRGIESKVERDARV